MNTMAIRTKSRPFSLARGRVLACVALLAGMPAVFAQSPSASAQDFPSKPVRIIVGVSPGGGQDLVARLVARKLSEKWARVVTVENRPGGGTIIATDLLAKSPPDGTTIMLCTTVFSINVSLVPKLPYDTFRDFIPVTLAAMAPNVVVVHPSVPATTLKELIAYAKANPGKLNYGYPGAGTASHLAGELLKLEAGIDVVGVAYKGTQPMMTAMLAGEIDYMIDITNSLQHVRSGKLRAFAVTSSKRLTSVPEIPTVAEAGLPGYEAITWFGFIVPSGTPQAIIDVLNREINSALRSPEVSERIKTQGMEVLGSTPQEFDRHLHAEVDKWARVVREARIKRD
jgi:tripartite-type tricarboxylate transporter receptor subunit TctC